MRQIQGKLVLLRVSGEFELPRVRVIGVQLYMYMQLTRTKRVGYITFSVSETLSANINLFASLCAIFLVTSCAAEISRSKYDHFAALEEFENFKLYWSVNDEQKEISFAVEVRTTGWVGFGISSGNGKMKGSDLVIGWVKDCKGYLTVSVDPSLSRELTGW